MQTKQAERDWVADPWIFCGSCGAPRHHDKHPCPECRDVQFSTVPNVQFEAWGQRQMLAGKKKLAKKLKKEAAETQGLLFEMEPAVKEVCPVCLRKCKLFRRLHKLAFGSPEFKSRWFRQAHKEVCPLCKKAPAACEAWKREHEAKTCIETQLGSTRAGRQVASWWVPPQSQESKREHEEGNRTPEDANQTDPGADAPGHDDHQPDVAGAGQAHQ